MHVLLIEDEAIAAEKLALLIHRHDPTITILATLDSVKSAVVWLRANPAPDLIFLDIHLSDGQSFDIFQQVEVHVPIIFTTAYNEYAIKAFEVNSIDYLLKPIKPEDVARGLEKYESIRQEWQQQSPFHYQELAELINKPTQAAYKQRFLVKVGTKMFSIHVDEIAYFYTADKTVYLMTRDGRHIPIDYYLDQLANLLDPQVFIKANRQYILRHDAIESMHTYSSSRVKVKLIPEEPREVIISTDKVPQFKEWLDM
ncbi:two-component system, LytT family, response regulator [Catalinimonas alkaloidigena]|uniref:Two-component system, LytT family, response regulator n=1 Tax=Catalinimonas alkaloidigena TaxID=1075417 RepID=A0A1G9H8M3_9BACT|nr:LytTR family DNA-binding domain-containing protein [Catalinimonas alkaloidigena]SDL09358.1 two-component system, LytT family, response regulator [Catalinimonas alkaloidigena]